MYKQVILRTIGLKLPSKIEERTLSSSIRNPRRDFAPAGALVMIAVLVLSTSVVAHRGKVTTDNYLAPAGKNRTKPRPSNAPAVQDFGNVPAIFEANRGQARKEVKFLARGN